MMRRSMFATLILLAGPWMLWDATSGLIAGEVSVPHRYSRGVVTREVEPFMYWLSEATLFLTGSGCVIVSIGRMIAGPRRRPVVPRKPGAPDDQ